MKKLLIVLALVAAASAVAALVRGEKNADKIIDGTGDDSMFNYLGV